MLYNTLLQVKFSISRQKKSSQAGPLAQKKYLDANFSSLVVMQIIWCWCFNTFALLTWMKRRDKLIILFATCLFWDHDSGDKRQLAFSEGPYYANCCLFDMWCGSGTISGQYRYCCDGVLVTYALTVDTVPLYLRPCPGKCELYLESVFWSQIRHFSFVPLFLVWCI